jgi:TonB family protein
MPLTHTSSAEGFLSVPTRPTVALPTSPTTEVDSTSWILQIAVASVTLHLLAVAWSGSGVPARRVPRTAASEIAPTSATIEQVELTPEVLPETPPPAPLQAAAPAPDAPPPATDLALPPLPAVVPISAVPSSVPVAFGLHVNGPVRLVGQASEASGAVGSRRVAEPIALDLAGEQNLVLPVLSYPTRAKRLHLTGTAVLDFHTTAAGEITDVRVRVSSGHLILDDSAKQNLGAGRWKGRPGYYLKAFEFTLQ